jgi:hypothetical protein
MSEQPLKFKTRPEDFKNEKDVKAEVKKIILWYRKLFYSMGFAIWDFMPVSNGMGKHGVPDFNLSVFGLYVAIETKYGGKKPTPRQKDCLEEIRKSGGIAVVVDENNVDLVSKIFSEIYAKYINGEFQVISVSGASNPL